MHSWLGLGLARQPAFLGPLLVGLLLAGQWRTSPPGGLRAPACPQGKNPSKTTGRCRVDLYECKAKAPGKFGDWTGGLLSRYEVPAMSILVPPWLPRRGRRAWRFAELLGLPRVGVR